MTQGWGHTTSAVGDTEPTSVLIPEPSMAGTLPAGTRLPQCVLLRDTPLGPKDVGAPVSWPIPGPFPTSGTKSSKAFGRRPEAETEQQIRDALATPGRPGFQKIAAQFGVATGTVQRIAQG
jgi:hypothetical protein